MEEDDRFDPEHDTGGRGEGRRGTDGVPLECVLRPVQGQWKQTVFPEPPLP